MRTALPLVSHAGFAPWLLGLAACSTPPGLPTVDESLKRPVNARAEIELQVCTNELHNLRLLQAQSERREQTAAATLGAIAAHQQALAAVQKSIGSQELPNRIFTVHFAFGDATVVVPDEIAAALVAAAQAAPLVVLRGRTDGDADTSAEGRIAQARAGAIRDYLVSAGVDAARIRSTYQPAGDHMANNASPEGRRLNRRVEIEVYGVQPVPFDPAVVSRR